MLSSQTKGRQTSKASQKLRSYGLTIEKMIDIDQAELEKLIYGVAFHRRKAEYIKKTAKVLKEQHGGVVPSKLDDILSLPGVGMKMALLLQQGSFGIVEGISVDTHVHRVANLLSRWVLNKGFRLG